ncbi:MAG TPA: protein kinase [Thermoanaerobaculia bacterium]|nr:protein kinase [Thermoanaerobaculia bacterium]
MDAARWRVAKGLLQAALDRPAAERSAFLDASCAGDDTLRAEVAALLEAHAASGDRFERSPVATARRAAEAAGEVAPPERLGPYRVLRELGRGGMGTVYLAEREGADFRQRVAIKLIHRGMDSDAIVRRFRTERRILAGLDHPNIARLFDGGTTGDGLPYFVMEHVDGEPIDRWCAAHGSSIDQRLQLFRQVCAAVHYAHQNLVVHRDLKPGNILVTAGGTPKLLDFGIAKLLDAEASATGTEEIAEDSTVFARPMTPEVASPEQVRGEPITTASDVYSLGVLLYRLLAGRPPYRIERGTSAAEVIRIVSEVEPEPPSTAAGHREASSSGPAPPRLGTDLDAIVLTAMRKDPARRYASADQLSEDLRRYLAGLPVLARRDSIGYRTRKFVARHRPGVAAAALAGIALVATTGIAVEQARVAERQRARAERRFADVRRLANSFLFEFHDAIRNLPGSTPARELVVEKALEYLDSLAQEAGDSRDLQRELAAAYQKVGDVQGLPDFQNLGDTRGAEASYRRSLGIRRALLAADPLDVEAKRGIGLVHSRLGKVRGARGDAAGAEAELRAALEIAEELWAHRSHAKARRDLFAARILLGDARKKAGDPARAMELFRGALALADQGKKESPQDAERQRDDQVAAQRVAGLLAATGDFKGALALGREQLAFDEATAAAEPSNAEAQRDLATTLNDISEWRQGAGDLAGARAAARRAVSICSGLLTVDPKNSQARTDLAETERRLGAAQEASGDFAGALASYSQALAHDRDLAAADPGDPSRLGTVAQDLERIGSVESALSHRAAKSRPPR